MAWPLPNISQSAPTSGAARATAPSETTRHSEYITWINAANAEISDMRDRLDAIDSGGGGAVAPTAGNSAFYTTSSWQSNPTTVNLPSGLADNDFMIMVCTVNPFGGTETFTTPSNWTLLYTYPTASAMESRVYVKRRVTNETQVTIDSSAGGTGAKIAVAISSYKGVGGTGIDSTSIVGGTTGYTAATTNSTSPRTAAAINTSTHGPTMLVLVGACKATTVTTDSIAPSGVAGAASTAVHTFTAGGGSVISMIGHLEHSTAGTSVGGELSFNIAGGHTNGYALMLALKAP
jgi:hypothetical protein